MELDHKMDHKMPPPSYREAISTQQMPRTAFPTISYTQEGQSATASSLPIVIPQSSKVFRGVFFSPFVRAYPPQLASVSPSMPKADFIRFIDDLNEAFIASPYFQALGLAGTLTSFVPLHIAQIVGSSVSLASNLASTATSYGRTRAFVKAANEKIFQPRGLQLRVLSTKDMMTKIGLDSTTVQLPPLPEFDGSWAVNQEGQAEDPRIRWLRALDGRIAPLDWNVPAVAQQENWLKRAGAWQAERQQKKQTKDLHKERREADEESDKQHSEVEKKRRSMERKREKIWEKMRSEEAKASRQMQRKGPGEGAKIEHELRKELAKLQEEVDKEVREFEKEAGKGGKDIQKAEGKADKKEQKIVQKIRWMVILPSSETPVPDQEIDDGVQGIDERN